MTDQDPAKDGSQPDLRAWPKRHPWAAHRLKLAERVAEQLGVPSAGRKMARESLPQARKPSWEKMPRFQLKPLPFKTFGELPALGLSLSVYCSNCHKTKPVEIGERLMPHRWGRVRFTCSADHYSGRKCASYGHLHLNPVEPLDPALNLVSMACERCLPPWFAEDVQLERPPWSSAPIDVGKERYQCPACGGQVRATFHGKPATDRSMVFALHILAAKKAGGTGALEPLIADQFYPVPFF